MKLNIFWGRAQHLNVENVLFSATCEFVPDEVALGYDHNPNLPIDNTIDPVLPSLIETKAVNSL